MPIFRILNLGNEVPNLVSEFQNALVFLGLKNKSHGIWTRGTYFMCFGSFVSNVEILAITKKMVITTMVVSLELPQVFQFWEFFGHPWHLHTMPGCLSNPDLAGRCREFCPKVGVFLVDPERVHLVLKALRNKLHDIAKKKGGEKKKQNYWCIVTLQSTLRPHSPFISESFTVGSFTVCVKPAVFTISIFRSRSSLCLNVTKTPFLQLRAWQTVNSSPSASQWVARLVGVLPYLNARASLNHCKTIILCLDNCEPCGAFHF